MFRIKICGLTTPADALAAMAAGADALGLNFYRRSVRFVSAEGARAIAEAVRRECAAPAPTPRLVGVFVNAEPAAILAAVRAASLDAVQLHGDETPARVHEIFALLEQELGVARPALLRAWRCQGALGLAQVQEYLAQLQPGLLSGLLLDAHAPGAYGGTGQTVDWRTVGSCRSQWGGLPLLLAGGLTPDNVRQAIALARPDGVDTASGVESAPGRKDPAKMQAFVAAARQALGAGG